MRTKSIALAIAAVLVGAIGGSMLSPRPTGAVSREIIQLQEQMSQLLQGQQAMRSAIDSNNASMRTLVQQSLDSVNALNAQMGTLQKNVQEATANSGSKIDTMSSQTQGLSDNLSDVQARVGKLATQMNDIQGTLQSIDGRLAGGATPGSAPAPGAAGGTARSGRSSCWRSRRTARATDFLRCPGFRRTRCTKTLCATSLPGSMTSRGRSSATT